MGPVTVAVQLQDRPDVVGGDLEFLGGAGSLEVGLRAHGNILKRTAVRLSY